jgi:hypothetical protein
MEDKRFHPREIGSNSALDSPRTVDDELLLRLKINGGALQYIKEVSPTLDTMSYVAYGKCRHCGRQNEWRDRECPGCHIKRRPMKLFALFGLVLLALATAIAGGS